jgi:hypothetical protein
MLPPAIRSKKITFPKKVRKINDINAWHANKSPNLGSAESRPQLLFNRKFNGIGVALVAWAIGAENT